MGLCRRNILTNELVRDSLTSSRTQLPNACQHMRSENLNGTQTAHTEQRVLQRDGFHLFHIRYWSDELRWLMGQETRKYTLKYDPRDLSRIFVLTEEGIIEARPADLTRPAITL